jgi:hypothetical protein
MIVLKVEAPRRRERSWVCEREPPAEILTRSYAERKDLQLIAAWLREDR